MDTERTKPSSKIIALAIVVAAIVAASWLIQSDWGTPKKTEKSAVTVTGTKKTYSEEIDTDEDGLKNWEELLWGFNPNNPDTDGDGVPDAVEKQEIQTTTLTRRQEFAKLIDPTDDANWESMSYTEQVSGLLLSNYLSYKQTGVPLTEDDALAIVESIPTYDLPERDAPRLYGISDIRISDNTSADSMRDYGNKIGAILSVPEGETAPNELLVLMSFLQTGNEDAFARDLQEVDSRYGTVISQMLEINVPSPLATAHLAAVNALSAVRSDVRDFNSFAQDPFLALSVFNTYNENVTQRGEAFAVLRDTLEAAGVIFSKTEPGYLLTVLPQSL